MENHFNCIYCYTNKINGKKYVGQSVDFIKRHKQHIRQAYNENCKAYDYAFHCAIRKHGIENFEIEILKENLQNQDELNYWEKFYIVEFDTLANNRKGYNLASGGHNGNAFAGKTDDEMKEISKKISESKKGKLCSEETKRKMSESKKGKFIGENNPMYGKKGENSPIYGKQRSEETKRKISESRKGKFTGEKNNNTRKIIQIDVLTKQIVFIWQYVKQATDFYGISKCTLNRYLKGKTKSGHEYNNFLWYYIEEYQQLTK